jgi:hypothetical protein
MAGQIPPIDFVTFLLFVGVIIVWLSLGSWGATLLTRMHYLEPDSPQVARGSEVTRRVGPRSVSPQMILMIFGPILLIIALVLPKHS